MTTIRTSAQYPLPQRLEPRLAELDAYWDGLKRGYGIMPYWDDVDMTKLGDLRHHVVLLDVMGRPPRFRFSLVGDGIVSAYGTSLEGRFVDKVPATGPLEEMQEQCRAAVKESAPTYFHRQSAGTDGPSYARLVLPLWGNGQVDMLIGAIESSG